MQASESLVVPVARVQYMADGVVILSPPAASHAALDDISQEEVFKSFISYWCFCVVSMLHSHSCMFGFRVFSLCFAFVLL